MIAKDVSAGEADFARTYRAAVYAAADPLKPRKWLQKATSRFGEQSGCRTRYSLASTG